MLDTRQEHLYPENMDTKLTTLRKTVAQRVRRMTPAQARQWLAEYQAAQAVAGPTMFSEPVRNLTGGFNSQSINFYVVRKVFERSKA